jgi:serine/threonine protein kinase
MKKQAHPQPHPNKHNKKEIILLDQGSNGCIFKDTLKCSTKQIQPRTKDHRSYISKVHLEIDAKNEETIGKQLATIPNFRYHFAPILDSCRINLSTIDERQIEKCDIVSKYSKKTPPPVFVSSKIQYLGKTTMGDHLFDMVKRPTKYITKILDTHIYLLNSIEKMQQVGIVHLDLKGNNIMHDEKNDLPIIIDFGMSVHNIETLDTPNYQTVFPAVVEDYFPWCIDIILLCYIAKNRATKLAKAYEEKMDDQSVAEMKRHCSVYVFKNPVLQIQQISQEERLAFEARLHKWVDTQKSKSWTQFAKELISYHKSWDNYALSAIYLLELEDIDGPNQDPFQATSETPDTPPSINTQRKTSLLVDQYLTVLKTNVLQESKDRWTPTATSTQIKTVFRNVKRETLMNFVNHQLTKLRTPEYLKYIRDRKRERSFREKEYREKIIKKRSANLKR